MFATSDSIAQAAQAFLAENPQASDNVATALRQKFGSKEIKVEKVIASKGENAITDYLGFGGEKPEALTSTKCLTPPRRQPTFAAP